jgi:transposase
LAKLVQGTVCKILDRQAVKAHKMRYYLERRDPDFEKKMAQVLCVYREVEILKQAAAQAQTSDAEVAIVSYDEKTGMQAIATTAPDLPPKPGVYATFARDHEYRRHGTLSLLAGIDLVTGKVHAMVKDRHRSCEFVEFLKLLDAAYPTDTAIKLILDNHSAHISKETKAWLATQPAGRLHPNAQARLLAQPHRGLLLQACSLGAAPYPRRLQAGTQTAHLGRHRRHQQTPRRPFLVLQTRPSRMNRIRTLETVV